MRSRRDLADTRKPEDQRKHHATGQARYWIEFIHGRFRRTSEADGLAPRIGGGKAVAGNLPVAVDLVQNEQLLVAFGDFVARGVDRRCPR